MRFGSFIGVVGVIIALLALGRDYYGITYQPDDGGLHVDIGRRPDPDRSEVKPVPRPRRTTPVARDGVQPKTVTEEPQIIVSPSETAAPPSDPPTETPTSAPAENPGPTFTDPNGEPGGEPGGETATPAP
ncbi:hypothetical protein [Paractinoplanes atraurantiacus]|uniref:Uncharacterized protein n=1 Tax=Paractinoplanes atraurantiacus TaxID=1036182 RepID=A0A285I0X2_9ACTN|nr:hypothetical protein [Actinoplanes atraurantiacus]SNY41599.1 hypothetical protein SAMN05421748_106185 [Actinoplanes atraurantiacus]